MPENCDQTAILHVSLQVGAQATTLYIVPEVPFLDGRALTDRHLEWSVVWSAAGRPTAAERNEV